MHWQASESQSSQRAPVDGLAAHAGDGCLATASLSHWHVRRRSGFGCAASAVAPAALQGHRQYAPLQVPAAEAGPQSLRRLPLPVFEPPSLLSLRVPPPPVRPALGECGRCSALSRMPLLTGRRCVWAPLSSAFEPRRRVTDALLLPCTALALALQVPRVLLRRLVAELPVPRPSRPRRLRSARPQMPIWSLREVISGPSSPRSELMNWAAFGLS